MAPAPWRTAASPLFRNFDETTGNPLPRPNTLLIDSQQLEAGETAMLTVEHLGDVRLSTRLFHLTQRLPYTKWRDPGQEPKLYLFGQSKRIAKDWLDTCLVCTGGTYPALLMYQELADMACNRITAGITRALEGQRPIKALLDPYNPTGSTAHVRFTTSKELRWDTKGPPPKNHVNWVICDNDRDLPLGLGMALRTRRPARVGAARGPLRLLGLTALGCLVLDRSGRDGPDHRVRRAGRRRPAPRRGPAPVSPAAGMEPGATG
jgi:hypothetical protein